MKLSRKFRSLFRRDKLDAGMAEEMRIHVELQTELNRKAGMKPDDARFAALRQFGNVARIQERVREGRFGIWWEQLGRDAGFAVRSLARARGFALTTVATLTLGIGVATLVFQLVFPQLFHAWRFPNPAQLFYLGYGGMNNPNGGFQPVLWRAQVQAYEEQAGVFSEMAVMNMELANVLMEGRPVLASIRRVSPDYFHTLGVRPAMGRGFLPEDHRDAAPPVVVISDRFWRTQFHSRPDILGQTVLIARTGCTIVGVLRRDQAWPAFGVGGDIFRPLAPFHHDPAQPLDGIVFAIGRLKAGISPQQAAEKLAAVDCRSSHR